MYKANISATVLTRHDEHEFGDAIPTRKSLEMRQDVHQPTFDGEVQTGVTIIPFHAVNAAAFAYSTSNTPDPVDANCVENESGGCETLYEGNVTFTYDEDEGAMAGTLNMTGAFTEGDTVNVTLGGGTASGTLEDHDGMLGATLSIEGNVVGAIFTVDGVTTIDMPGRPGEPVTMSVKVEQCSPGGGDCDIRVNPNPIEINWGEGAPPQTVNVEVTGSNVTYEIGDQTIISVSGSAPNYSVTGIAYGDTTLTFSNENCTVVAPVSVISIK